MGGYKNGSINIINDYIEISIIPAGSTVAEEIVLTNYQVRGLVEFFDGYETKSFITGNGSALSIGSELPRSFKFNINPQENQASRVALDKIKRLTQRAYRATFKCKYFISPYDSLPGNSVSGVDTGGLEQIEAEFTQAIIEIDNDSADHLFRGLGNARTTQTIVVHENLCAYSFPDPSATFELGSDHSGGFIEGADAENQGSGIFAFDQVIKTGLGAPVPVAVGNYVHLIFRDSGLQTLAEIYAPVGADLSLAVQSVNPPETLSGNDVVEVSGTFFGASGMQPFFQSGNAIIGDGLEIRFDKMGWAQASGNIADFTNTAATDINISGTLTISGGTTASTSTKINQDSQQFTANLPYRVWYGSGVYLILDLGIAQLRVVKTNLASQLVSTTVALPVEMRGIDVDFSNNLIYISQFGGARQVYSATFTDIADPTTWGAWTPEFIHASSTGGVTKLEYDTFNSTGADEYVWLAGNGQLEVAKKTLGVWTNHSFNTIAGNNVKSVQVVAADRLFVAVHSSSANLQAQILDVRKTGPGAITDETQWTSTVILNSTNTNSSVDGTGPVSTASGIDDFVAIPNGAEFDIFWTEWSFSTDHMVARLRHNGGSAGDDTDWDRLTITTNTNGYVNGDMTVSKVNRPFGVDHDSVNDRLVLLEYTNDVISYIELTTGTFIKSLAFGVLGNAGNDEFLYY